MRGQNTFRRLLIVLALVVIPLTAYFTLSHVGICQAQFCACSGGTCITANTAVDAFRTNFTNATQPAMRAAMDIMVAEFHPLAEFFYYGIYPVMDWTVWKITIWFDHFWMYNLQPAMQAMTAELTVAQREQDKALGAFADGVNLNRKRWAINDIDVESHREVRPSESMCTVASLAGGITRSDRISDTFNSASAASRLWRTANNMDTTAETGMAQDMERRARRYRQRYCRTDYNGGEASCEADAPFADRDIDVAGMIFARDTIPIDPDSEDPIRGGDTMFDVNELIDTLAEPFAKDPVVAGGRAGRYALLAAQTYKVKRQVVYDSLEYIVSRRVPGGLPASFVDELSRFRDLTDEETSSNPSRNEVLRALMTQRYRSGLFGLSQIDEPENNERELVVQQALQLIQMSDMLDLMDHYSLLLTSQASTEVINNYEFSAASAGAPLR